MAFYVCVFFFVGQGRLEIKLLKLHFLKESDHGYMVTHFLALLESFSPSDVCS